MSPCELYAKQTSPTGANNHLSFARFSCLGGDLIVLQGLAQVCLLHQLWPDNPVLRGSGQVELVLNLRGGEGRGGKGRGGEGRGGRGGEGREGEGMRG